MIQIFRQKFLKKYGRWLIYVFRSGYEIILTTRIPSYCHLTTFWARVVKVISCTFLISIIPLPCLASLAYSNATLDDLEKEFIQLINQSDSVERNPLANQYINHLGKRLARSTHIPHSYFFIVKSNEINAFAGPGGYIGINSALILASSNESELAAVMAHEIAHARLHHLFYMIEHEKQMRIPMLASMLASIALGAINPTLGEGAMMASMTNFAQEGINFTRANEKAADRIGINMLIKSQLDPRGMVDFFKKMQANARYYYTANIPSILRTHPLDAERIAEAESRCEHIVKKLPDNLNYNLFKELIRVSVSNNKKQLLDYYEHQCRQKNNSISCQYGHALVLLNLNKFKQAKDILESLLYHDSDNLFYQISMAQTELASGMFAQAASRLHKTHEDYPENYAVIMTYAEALLAAKKEALAIQLLLQGSRQFKQDLPICEALAQARASAHQTAYAYFTLAQCQLLQGRKYDAIRQLKLAKSMAKNNYYLNARITAILSSTASP